MGLVLEKRGCPIKWLPHIPNLMSFIKMKPFGKQCQSGFPLKILIRKYIFFKISQMYLDDIKSKVFTKIDTRNHQGPSWSEAKTSVHQLKITASIIRAFSSAISNLLIAVTKRPAFGLSESFARP